MLAPQADRISEGGERETMMLFSQEEKYQTTGPPARELSHETAALCLCVISSAVSSFALVFPKHALSSSGNYRTATRLSSRPMFSSRYKLTQVRGHIL